MNHNYFTLINKKNIRKHINYNKNLLQQINALKIIFFNIKNYLFSYKNHSCKLPDLYEKLKLLISSVSIVEYIFLLKNIFRVFSNLMQRFYK